MPPADSMHVRVTVNGRGLGAWAGARPTFRLFDEVPVVAHPLVPPGTAIFVSPSESKDPNMHSQYDSILGGLFPRETHRLYLGPPSKPRLTAYVVTVLPLGSLQTASLDARRIVASCHKAAAETMGNELEHDGRRRKAIVTDGKGDARVFALEPRQGFDVKAA
jgi:hypothetical protein